MAAIEHSAIDTLAERLRDLETEDRYIISTTANLVADYPPGHQTRLAFTTDTQQLWYDDGGAWNNLSVGGVGPAPIDAQYLTMIGSAVLTNERILTAGEALTLTDGGAGGAATLDVNVGDGLTYDAVNDEIDAAQALLSATHTDTAASAVTRGDLIYGNATPEWDDLAISANNYDILSVNGAGNEPEWQTFDWDNHIIAAGGDGAHDHSGAGEGGEIPLASLGDWTRGDLIVGGVADWDDLAIGANNTVVKSDGTDVSWDNVDHGELTGVGADDHHDAFVPADIDTLAELNAIVADATLDDAGDPRDPNDHAHTAAGDGGTVAHMVLTGVSDDDHHDPVTLDADADVLLSLSTQEIGFDDQGANEVLVGPSTGADDAPTFRALDARDMPSSLAEQIFTADDGLLLLNSNCPMGPDSWTSQRGQVVTLEGAFNPRQGPFAGSKGLMFEPAGTNLCTNPVFGVNVTDGWNYYQSSSGGSRSHSTDHSLFGSASCKLIATDGGTGKSLLYNANFTTLNDGDSVSASVYVYSEDALTVRVEIRNSGGIETYSDFTTKPGQWVRFTESHTHSGASDTYGMGVALISTDGVSEIWVDGIGYEKTLYASSLIHGDKGEGYAWTGTAHNSTSTRSMNYGDLDELAPALSDLDTVTYSVWVQAQYDADDANWPCGANQAHIFDVRGADNSNRLFLRYDPDDVDALKVYVNGGYRIDVENQDFEVGDWLHLVLTLDYGNNSYKLYLNGELIGSDTTALTAPTGLVNWKLGVPYNAISTYSGGWTFGEYAVLNRVLSAEEVAALYHKGAPLVDAGAFTLPVDNIGPLAASWSILHGSQTHTGDTTYTEAGSNQESRFGFGTWVSGNLQFEAVLKISDAAETAYAMLQWDDSGTWRDVSGSEVSLTGSTDADLVRSRTFYLSPAEREYRVVIKPSDAAETATIYKACLICTPGGLDEI